MVERRSPKPNVVSSNLTAPANKKNRPKGRFFYWYLGEVDENSRESEFDAKRKAGGCTPVSETNEREGTSIAERNVADNLTAPANKKNRPKWRFFYWHLGEVDENSRESEFDAKRKAGGCMPVSETNEREGTSIAERNVADNLIAPASQDEDAEMRLFL